MTGTGNDILQRQAEQLPDALQSVFTNWADRIQAAGHEIPGILTTQPAIRRTLARLVASSEFAASTLFREWPWFARAISREGLDPPAADPDTDEDARPETRLRRRRNRGLLRILWRSLDGRDDTWQSLAHLSALADSLIAEAHDEALRAVPARLGRPVNGSGEEIPLIILAMGKLGGGELNFSSDVDLIFLYPEDGSTDGEKTLSAHEYFVRLSQRVVRLLDDVTEDGFVYRVDTRLRPFGDSGPPVTSFSAFENYLLQHGRGWERYAYVKARPVGLTACAPAALDLGSEIIEPFVYRQYLDYGVFESLREMKSMIETEVRKRELSNNVKAWTGRHPGNRIHHAVDAARPRRRRQDAEMSRPSDRTRSPGARPGRRTGGATGAEGCLRVSAAF